MFETLELLYQKGLIDALDLEFARFMGELAGDSSRELLLGCALASRVVDQGDVCLDLDQAAGQLLLRPELDRNAVFAPELGAWRRALQRSRVVGAPGELKPLVLDGRDRLYLYRYWNYENLLAAELRQRVGQIYEVDEARLRDGLQRLFPSARQAVDWQKVAAALAVLRGFSVISGGPGTGKTTTLAKILALLIEQGDGKAPRIRLAAPTGKAAARMQEALLASKENLAGLLEPAVLAAIPTEASTLHRLLGPQPDGVYFRHNQDNPLNLDVLVIDEASMVDLALMTKTVWALPPQARLILLGDKDQLSSVEAGTVLGELCAQVGGYSSSFAGRLSALTGEAVEPAATASPLLPDATVLLQHSYRFSGDSGIGRLAEAVNRGDEAAIKALHRQNLSDVCWYMAPPEAAEQDLLEWMLTGYKPYLQQVHEQASVVEIFAAFQDYQVLCPQRVGPTGVEQLNELVETVLKARLRRSHSEWYPGRPIMITRNDYQLRLFNGDIGITLPDPDNEERLRVYFQGSDGVVRSFPITRLPAYEPVFAMTIHKSQGSEFDEVLLVLPLEDSRVLTRELIYTGITRAKQKLAVWGSLDILLQAVRRPIQRSSGLGEKLQAAVGGGGANKIVEPNA